MALSQSAPLVDRDKFPPALAADAYRNGDPAIITDLMTLARNKLKAGGGEVSFLISAGENGKAGGQECRCDCMELYTLCDIALGHYQALKLAGADPLGGAAVSCTYPDFSWVSGFYPFIRTP